MQGGRIIDFCRDPIFGQEIAQFIAFPNPDRELIVDVEAICRLNRWADIGFQSVLCNQGSVVIGVDAAGFCPLGKYLSFTRKMAA